MAWVLIALLIILVFLTLPAWPHSRSWGYYPSGVIALVLVLLILVVLFGYW